MTKISVTLLNAQFKNSKMITNKYEYSSILFNPNIYSGYLFIEFVIRFKRALSSFKTPYAINLLN